MDIFAPSAFFSPLLYFGFAFFLYFCYVISLLNYLLILCWRFILLWTTLLPFPLVLAPPPSTLLVPPNVTQFWPRRNDSPFTRFKGSQTASKSVGTRRLRPIFAGDRGCRDVNWVRESKSAMDVKTRVSESRLLARANIQTPARFMRISWPTLSSGDSRSTVSRT